MKKTDVHKETSVHDAEKNRKIIQIVCSILVALGVWLYVGEEKTVSVTTQVHDLPVEFAGEDTTLAEKGLMLLSGYDTTVDLKLKGPRMVLWKLDKDEIRIVADTSPIQDTGVQSLEYQVVYPNNIQRNQVQVVSLSASVEKWVEAVCNMQNTDNRTADMSDYDMKNCIKKLEQIYLNNK